MSGRTDETEQEQARRRWRPADFIGLLVFLLICAAVLPMVRDSYLLQDVWITICGAIGLK